MEWNVYYHRINQKKMGTLNIFEHYSFAKGVEKLIKEKLSKSEFSERLRKELFYYFCSKSEYEIIVSPWCGGGVEQAIKVDIYSQVMMNWERFVDYVWDYSKTKGDK